MQEQLQDFEAPAFDMETNLNFLDEIEQYDNPDSCDKSVANSSTKSASSSSEKAVNKDKSVMNSQEKQMVMIDQKQLQELMEAKLILESQKIASASQQLATTQKNTSDLIGAAFSNGLFNPPSSNYSNENQSIQNNENGQQFMPQYPTQPQGNQVFNYQPQVNGGMQNQYAPQFQGNYQNVMAPQGQQPEYYQGQVMNSQFNQFQAQNQFGAQNQNNFNQQQFQQQNQGLNYSSKAFVPNGQSNGQTINNITINNFGGQQEQENMLFPSLDSMKTTNPTKEQTFEVANATQQAGGVRPLHKKAFNKEDNQEESIIENKSEDCSEKRNNFEFPDGGWECSKCQNYNFKGRKACFRCKKNKSDDDNEGKPEHMSTVQSKNRKFKRTKEESGNEAAVTYEYSKDNRVHKYKANGNNNQERVGDWTCQRCFNHNFSFREVCNMCYFSHTESNKMLYQQQSNRLMVSQNMNQPMQMAQFPQSQQPMFVPQQF